jgi:hypothetical protein
LKMVAVSFSETFISLHKCTGHDNPEDRHRQIWINVLERAYSCIPTWFLDPRCIPCDTLLLHINVPNSIELIFKSLRRANRDPVEFTGHSLIKLNAAVSARLLAGTVLLTAKPYKAFPLRVKYHCIKGNKINLSTL